MNDEPDNENFEEKLRSIAREFSRSFEKVSELDFDEIAEAIGVSAERARVFTDLASRWLSDRAEQFGEEPLFGMGWQAADRRSRPAGKGPHPLDLPTEEQGLALSALDSGRWSVEPGTNTVVAADEGPAPRDAMSLASELRARDWIAADGSVTLVGRDALRRWMDGSSQS